MAPICIGCTRLHGDLRDPKCDAYPERIPNAILLSKADHRKPYEGDQGLQFAPEDKDASAYAAGIFDRPEPS